MDPRDRLPPRTLPVLYFAFAHLCLGYALFTIAAEPEAVQGFFYHPRMFAVVHLITLGWITGSILGATYIVGPLALRMTIPSSWVDAVAFASYAIGASGVVAHFWLETYWGVATSGPLLLFAFVVVAVRTWRALGGSGARAGRWLVGAAFFNLMLAALWGTLLAANRETTILHGSQLQNVFAHAHLAAVGWAVLMVMGVGSRLLPMLFPAAPPSDRLVLLSGALVQAGVLGLGVALVFASRLSRLCAVTIAAGILLFLGQVIWMRLHPRPAPKKLKRPDLGVAHALQALLYLLISTGVGLFLVFSPEWELDWIMAYGVFGLLGFLGQVVVGVGMRLFPMFAWLEAWAGGGYTELPPSPHAMPLRLLQLLSVLAWTAGVPMLAIGLKDDRTALTVAGAWTLLAGLVAGALNSGLVLRHAYRGARMEAEPG